MEISEKVFLKPPFHLIGIGGVGMSGLAWLLHDLGYPVQGSDMVWNGKLEKLREKGVRVFLGHRTENIGVARTIIHSSAISPDNPELRYAKKKGLPIYSRGKFLALLVREKKTLVVAGTHGKTTTTSLIAFLLRGLGISDSYMIGGEIKGWERNAHWGKGEIMVLESDESDGSFLNLDPHIGIITSLDDDHISFYGDLSGIERAFQLFVEKINHSGKVFLHSSLQDKFSLPEVLTYGLEEGYISASGVRKGEKGNFFELKVGDRKVGEFFLPLPGEYNVENSLPALYLSLSMGGDIKEIKEVLATFPGVKRRVEFRGEIGGVKIFDDYAHHPTEIKKVIKIFPPEKLRVVFQPHRYSRFSRLLKDFAEALSPAREILLLPIYSASEPPLPGISSADLLSLLERKKRRVLLKESLEAVVEYLYHTLHPGDIILILGAGDVTRVGELLLEKK